MEFGLFKGLLGLLFFGAAFAVGLLQLAAVRKARLPARHTRGLDRKRASESDDIH